ncbi:MAG: hypothetical protein H7Y01_03930 [Ferruginibacter sp.]|nr:hypothetical protein [Chitinophagaceae bacterium]
MNRDLHDIDKLFRTALESHEETPTAGVKEALDTALDKKEAEKNKRRLIIWKRMSLLFLLLLTGFLLRESGILKNFPARTGAITADKKINPAEEEKNSVPGNPGENITSNSRGTSGETTNTKLEKPATRQVNLVETSTPQGATVPDISGINNQQALKKKIFSKKTAVQENKQAIILPINTQPVTTAHQEIPGKKINSVQKNNFYKPGEKINTLQVPEIYSISKITGLLATKLLQAPLPAVSDSLSKFSKAQTSNDKKVKLFKPSWLITAFASYERVGYKLDSDEPSAINSIKYREAHEPSFSGGLLLTRQITRRWSLQSGLVYTNAAIGMKPQKTYAFRDPTGDVAYKYITSSGYAFFKPGFGPQPAVGDSLTTAEAKHRIEHISVPLVIKHTFWDKKISISPGAGVEANFITKANLEVDIEDPFNREIVVVRKLNGTKPFYLSFVADADLRYNINKKIAITVRPVYKHAISPITKNNVVETYPHSFSVGAGVTIKF